MAGFNNDSLLTVRRKGHSIFFKGCLNNTLGKAYKVKTVKARDKVVITKAYPLTGSTGSNIEVLTLYQYFWNALRHGLKGYETLRPSQAGASVKGADCTKPLALILVRVYDLSYFFLNSFTVIVSRTCHFITDSKEMME